MGILDRFFSTPETLAQALVVDDTKAAQLWNDYLGTTTQKGELIKALRPGDLANFKKLYALISTELVEIAQVYRTDEEILADLGKIEHAHNLRKASNLENCFIGVERRHEYVFSIMKHLFETLSYELKLARQLSRSSAHDEEFINRIREFWDVEQKLLKQISGVKQFHSFFLQLVKGEHLIQQLKKQEKRILSLLERSLHNPDYTLIGAWGIAVRDGLIAKLEDLMAEGVIEYTPVADFDFVNRPEFVTFVKQTLANVRKKDTVKPETVNAFVHIFREWYNGREES